MQLILLVISIVLPSCAYSQYMSQLGQDRFVNELFFKNKKNGVFLDIGAHDGKTGSNTYFFEKDLGWIGICFEPLPHLFEALSACRDVVCINACVAAQSGHVTFLHLDSVDEQLSGMCTTYDDRMLGIVLNDIKLYGGQCHVLELPSVRLDDALAQYGITHVDFLSLDTEGSELEILKTIDFSKITIDVMTVENNFNEPHIRNYLEQNGYIFVQRLTVDDVYVRAGFMATY